MPAASRAQAAGGRTPPPAAPAQGPARPALPPCPRPPAPQVGAIVGSCKREPITVGKPAEFMLDNIATQFGLKREQICMVRGGATAGAALLGGASGP